MKSISLKTKIVTGLITGGVLLSSVSLAFATTTKPLNTDGKTALRNEFRQPKGNLEAMLKVGVSSNIITQDESDKILAYENSKIKTRDKKESNWKENNRAEKPDMFKELVDNNILTQAKADALKASEQAQMEATRQQELETKLNKLVADKTITEDQATKIKDAIIKEEATMKADFEKIKTMTQEERKAYMDSNKDNHVNPLKALVDNGTITQAQADKVGFGGPGEHGKFDGKIFMKNGYGQQGLETKLDKLVTDKTITEDQATKIKDAITKEEAAMKAEVEKIKNMTQEQRKAYMDSNKEKHVNPLKALVDNGTITQAQADKIGFGGLGAGNHNGEGRYMPGQRGK